jgi:hypothetical protein
MMQALRESLLLIALAAIPLGAQEHRYLSALEWSVAVPIGNTRDFMPATSFSGAIWEGRWMDHPHTSIGALLGFNEFYHRESGTFDFPGGAVTGDSYRHLLAIPVMFTAHWYPSAAPDDPRWFIGGGAGIQYTEQLFQLGLAERRRTNWNAVITPEIGLAFSAWYATGGIISLRYHLPSESGGFLGSTQRRFSYFSLSFGLGYR